MPLAAGNTAGPVEETGALDAASPRAAEGNGRTLVHAAPAEGSRQLPVSRILPDPGEELKNQGFLANYPAIV